MKHQCFLPQEKASLQTSLSPAVATRLNLIANNGKAFGFQTWDLRNVDKWSGISTKVSPFQVILLRAYLFYQIFTLHAQTPFLFQCLCLPRSSQPAHTILFFTLPTSHLLGQHLVRESPDKCAHLLFASCSGEVCQLLCLQSTKPREAKWLPPRFSGGPGRSEQEPQILHSWLNNLFPTAAYLFPMSRVHFIPSTRPWKLQTQRGCLSAFL